MYCRVLPPISQVALVAVEHRESAIQEDPKPLRGQSIVFVDLGKPVGERVPYAINRVVERYVRHCIVREHPRDFASKRAVQAVVVVRVQKSPPSQVPAKRLDLPVRETDVSVSGQIEVRVVGQVRVGKADINRPVGDTDRRPLRDLAEEVR